MKKIFISYSHKNSKELDKLEKYISNTFQVDIHRDNRRIKPLDSIKEFMQSIRDSDTVVCFLSDDYLKSENCMYEVTELIRDDTLREPFLDKVIPIIFSSDKKPFHITDFEVQNKYLLYWADEFSKTESFLDNIEERKEKSKYRTTYQPLERKSQDRIKQIQGIVESLDTFLAGVCDQFYVNYFKLLESNYSLLYDILIDKNFVPKKNEETKARENFSKKSLQEIIDKIKPKSYSDPNNPEFPYDNPKFPATETLQVLINGKNILVKDESSNPTGTHKDRMAWEILLYYKRKLQSLVNSEKEVLKTPQLSIISSGSSALAIQALLNKFGLPPIKVLIKNGFKQEVYEKLGMAGCELFIKDLTVKKLNRNDVLNHTDNKNGIEVSFRDAIDPAHFEYYDWLSYEILNQNPTTVIVPFGSGELFTNILNVAKNEVLLNKQDKRFTGNKESISKCKYFGVTTTNPNSKYFKLCSYFFDCNQYNKEQMEMYRRLNICNNESKVVDLEEEYFGKAEKLCKKLKLNVEESSLSGFAFYLENEENFKAEERVIIVNTGKTKKILPPTTYIKNSGFGT